jgi:hypothetical protein
MAIIISYPVATPILSTLLLGTQHDPEMGASVTKNFSVSSIVSITMANGFKNLDVYANNAAALIGGLVAGEIYRTSTGVLMVAY